MAEQAGWVHEGETLDDLLLGDMKVIQARRGYRFSLDAVLLAHFPDLSGVERAVDLGTGCGVIPLILAARNNAIQVAGVELQPAMADRAQRSVKLNRLQERISIISADIREIEIVLPGGCAELVLSNPPFWRKGQGRLSRDPEQAVARHELHLELEEVWAKGAYILSPGGRMAVVQPVGRLAESLAGMEKNRLQVSRMRFVHAFHDRPAGLVLVEAQKERRQALKVLPPLIVYAARGEYSPEIRSWYNRSGSAADAGSGQPRSDSPHIELRRTP